MSCLKYDNVTALYRFYIAFGYPQSIFFNLTLIYIGLALNYAILVSTPFLSEID